MTQVFDAGEDAHGLFIVSEFIAGATLADILLQGPVEAMRAAEVCAEVADALAAAHAAGIIHRDIKPSNILISERGRVKVTDFGIAKALEAASAQSATGTMVGTPLYVAPEQARGKAVPASDQYSLGVVLYELLLGAPPFEGTPAKLLHAHEYEAPPSLTNERNTPDWLREIVHRTLAKQPDRRYPDMLALCDALVRDNRAAPETARLVALTSAEPARPQTPTQTTKTLPRRRRKSVVVGLALLSLLIVGLVAAFASGIWSDGKSSSASTSSVGGPSASGEEMPNLLGIELHKAETNLERRGATAAVRRRYATSVPRGRVLRQSPPAGTPLVSDAVVTLTVSKGTRTERVPTLVGLPVSEAQAAARRSGFTTEVRSPASGSAADNVAAQQPDANTSARPGSKIVITLAMTAPVAPPQPQYSPEDYRVGADTWGRYSADKQDALAELFVKNNPGDCAGVGAAPIPAFVNNAYGNGPTPFAVPANDVMLAYCQGKPPPSDVR